MTSEEIHAAGLCSVVPTIFQNCDNDWISKNGTCYQDSCCMSLEVSIQKNFHYSKIRIILRRLHHGTTGLLNFLT